MANYILKRIGSAAAVLLAVSLITFFVLFIIPGNAAGLILGAEATAEKLSELKAAMGLDRAWYIQYLEWLEGLLTFDLGTSYIYGKKVTELIYGALPVTFSITFFSIAMATIISVPLGMLGAIKKDSFFDYFSKTVMQIGSSMPSFWFIMYLVYFLAVERRLFPVTGYFPLSAGIGKWLNSIFLPSFVIAIGETGFLLRTVRTSMLNVLNEDYIDAAKAKGLTNLKIYLKYAAKSAMVAPLNVIGLQFAKLIGGTVVTESCFGLPGIGRLILVSVEQRDVFLLQGLVIFITAFVVVISLLVDIIIMLNDPRIRYSADRM